MIFIKNKKEVAESGQVTRSRMNYYVHEVFKLCDVQQSRGGRIR